MTVLLENSLNDGNGCEAGLLRRAAHQPSMCSLRLTLLQVVSELSPNCTIQEKYEMAGINSGFV